MGILFSTNSDERTLLFRGIILLGWYIAIVLISNFIIIGFVSGYAGLTIALDGVTDLERAFQVGNSARIRFFREYGDYTQYCQVAILLVLATLGKLPLTTKCDS
ncbi:MAG: hypothetical protein GY951_05515 [Psychromonas sp.]|nr:hypothetical protein [Psychromonas sp.]